MFLAAAAILVGSAAHAQSYGDQSQVLSVGVSEFHGVDGAQSLIDSVGYLRNAVDGGSWYYLAPLALPVGAKIEQICLYADDSDPNGFFYVQAYIVAVKLAQGGESPFLLQIPGASASSGDIGYGYYCSDTFDYTLRGQMDVDGDGFLDAAVHYLALYLPNPSQNALGFGGARITWRRQVSPAPSTQTFGDVPPTDGAFPFIEALALSGITAGCGSGGVYCPDAPLTRRQMAVFLAKALGLHWAAD
jgi:hypothetical protein